MIFIEDLRYKAACRYGKATLRTTMTALVADGTFAMGCYRAMAWSHRWHLYPVTFLLSKANALLGQCLIGRGAEFGPGFVLEHSQGIVISGAVRGGREIVLEHQVTIGSAKGGAPILGSRIYVGAGAKIIGPISIGDDVRVGANAVVVSDVPNGASVGGVPARILRMRDGEASPVASPND